MDPASIPACPRALEWFHPGPGGRAKTRRRSWSSRRRWVSAWLPLPAVLSPVWWPQRNWHPSSHANCAIAFPMGIIGDTTPNPTKWGAITNRVRSLALCRARFALKSWVNFAAASRKSQNLLWVECLYSVWLSHHDSRRCIKPLINLLVPKISYPSQ